MPAVIDFFDHHSVTKLYYPDCADIVREVTGASDVFPFDHNVRSAAGKQEEQRIRGGQQVQGPASIKVTGIQLPDSSNNWDIPSFFPRIVFLTRRATEPPRS